MTLGTAEIQLAERKQSTGAPPAAPAPAVPSAAGRGAPDPESAQLPLGLRGQTGMFSKAGSGWRCFKGGLQGQEQASLFVIQGVPRSGSLLSSLVTAVTEPYLVEEKSPLVRGGARTQSWVSPSKAKHPPVPGAPITPNLQPDLSCTTSQPGDMGHPGEVAGEVLEPLLLFPYTCV